MIRSSPVQTLRTSSYQVCSHREDNSGELRNYALDFLYNRFAHDDD